MIRKTVIAFLSVAACAALGAWFWSRQAPVIWDGPSFPHFPYVKLVIEDGELAVGQVYALRGGPLVRDHTFLGISIKTHLYIDPSLSTPISPVCVVWKKLALPIWVLFLVSFPYPTVVFVRAPFVRRRLRRFILRPGAVSAVVAVRRSATRRWARRIIVGLSAVLALATAVAVVVGHHSVADIPCCSGDGFSLGEGYVVKDRALAEWLDVPDSGWPPPKVPGWLGRREFADGGRAYLYVHGGGLTVAYFEPLDSPPVVAPMDKGFAGFRYEMDATYTTFTPNWWSLQLGPKELARYHLSGNAVRRSVRIPLWALLIVFCVLPAAAFVRGPLFRYVCRRSGLCVRCAYDLTGNTTGRCPECGEPVRSTSAPSSGDGRSS